VEFLTTLNFQTDSHTCTNLLDKYSEQKPPIYKCREFLKCRDIGGDCFPFQAFRTSNLPFVFLFSRQRLKV